MDNKNWNVKAIEDFASLTEVFDDIDWDTKNGGLSMTAKKDGQFIFGMGVLKVDDRTHVPEKVIYNRDLTIAIFPDGKKVFSRPTDDDKFDKEVGLAMCIAKHVCGGREEFLEAVENADVQTNKPAKGGVVNRETMAEVCWVKADEAHNKVVKEALGGRSGKTVTKKQKQTPIAELKAPYEVVAHKPYWHELEHNMRNILLRMLHSGHPDMVELVTSYANPDWCTCPAGVWSDCGCHFLRDGDVRGEGARYCHLCHFSKTGIYKESK